MPEAYLKLYGVIYSPGYVEMSGKSAIRQFYLREQESYINQHEWPIVGITQQVAVADALDSAASLWILTLTNVTAKRGHGSPLFDQFGFAHQIGSNYYQPYVTSVCILDMLEGENDSRLLVFPTLLGANSISQSDINIEAHNTQGLALVSGITKSGLTRSSIYNTFRVPSMHHLRWIKLNEDRFRGSSIGAIMFIPSTAGNQSQSVLMCNIAAGWGTSVITIQRDETFSGGSVSSVPNWAVPKYTNISVSELNGPTQDAIEVETAFQYPQFPQVPINISEDWANLLSPRFDSSNDTVINRLMQVQISNADDDPSASAQHILSAMVANGLARIGFSSVLQGQVRTTSDVDGSSQLDGNN